MLLRRWFWSLRALTLWAFSADCDSQVLLDEISVQVQAKLAPSINENPMPLAVFHVKEEISVGNDDVLQRIDLISEPKVQKIMVSS